MNKLEEFRNIELMCNALISSIGLHRAGIESSKSVIIRISYLLYHLEKIRDEGLKLVEEKSGSSGE